MTLALTISCIGNKKVLSSSNDTALFLPPKIETSVDMYIDKVDGKRTKFKLSDSAQVDQGNHTLLIRLEYQPASGTSLIVGGIANLLLRATTNKTFTSTIDINVTKEQEYRFKVKGYEDYFDLILINETTSKNEAIYKFKLNEGKFVRIF